MYCADDFFKNLSLCQQVGHTRPLPGQRLMETKEQPLFDFKIWRAEIPSSASLSLDHLPGVLVQGVKGQSTLYDSSVGSLTGSNYRREKKKKEKSTTWLFRQREMEILLLYAAEHGEGMSCEQAM